MQWLAGVPAFALLPSGALDEIAPTLGEEHHPAGSTVVAEGEAGDRLYLIVQGRAEVSTMGPGGPAVLATLGEGEYFGEMALFLPVRQRQATVTALTSLLVLTLGAPVFTGLLSRYPAAEKSFAAAAEVVATVKLLKLASPFSRWDPSSLRRLGGRLKRISVPAGAAIVKQGEQDDACYLLCTGQVEVMAEEDGASARRLATLWPGSLIGETAMLTEGPRNATVRALEPCELLVLRRADLLEVMGRDPRVAASVLELVRLRDRPRRADGILAQQRITTEGETITILKDPRRYRYYRLTAEGWFLWQRLDGKHTLRDLALEYVSAFKSFTPHTIAHMVGGLMEAGFVKTRAPRPDVADALAPVRRWERTLLRARRLLEWRVAIDGMDIPITWVYRRGAYRFYTQWGQMFLGALIFGGLLAFMFGATRFRASVFEGGGGALWIFLIPAFSFSLIVHEAGHALTAKAFGFEVPRVGVGWHWFAPIFFVDVSDIWLGARWPRIAVSLAGPYANMLLAAIAAMAGWLTPNPVAAGILWQYAVVSYLLALVNLSPLGESDGYHILMDLLDRPNLRAHALTWLGIEFSRSGRIRDRLRGHQAELVFWLSSLLYVVLISLVTVVSFRLLMWDWRTYLLPGAIAVSLAWLIALGIAVLICVSGGRAAQANAPKEWAQPVDTL